ncbi:unnamed protein product [Withania somnifera]
MAPDPPWRKELHSIHQAHKVVFVVLKNSFSCPKEDVNSSICYKKICAICGAIGSQEAIITCYRCKNIDVHKYCISDYPERALEDWCCEKCHTGEGIISSSSGLQNEYSEEPKLCTSAKICPSTVQPKKHSKFPHGHCIKWEKEVRTGKTKYLPVNQALGLFKKSGCPLKSTQASRVVSTKPQNLQNVKITEQSKRPVQSSKGPGCSTFLERRSPHVVIESRTLNPHMDHPHDPAPVPSRKYCQLGNCGSGQNKRMKFPGVRCINLEKEVLTGKMRYPPVEYTKLRNPNAMNVRRMMNPLMTHPCDPALVPSWKGCFDILNSPEFVSGMFNNCIQAHPPSRVRRKVYEFSLLLPDTLKFELVQRGDIWASLFNNHCPGKEDIGLYFRASERERSEIYISLVEFMCTKDFVMKTRINDVELLVLASTALCSNSQRWNSEHFLWGLFYHVEEDTVGCAEGGSNEVIDMEIDMIGEDICTTNEVDMEGYQNEVEMEIDMIAGENVGTQDIVVSTTTRNGFDSSLKESVTTATCNGNLVDNVPPGFIPRQLLLKRRCQLS